MRIFNTVRLRKLHHNRSQQFYFWQEMMQYFTRRAQDGEQCLVVVVLLFYGFIVHFASIIADRLFAEAVVERPDIEEQTRDPKKNEASRRRRNRPFSTTMTAWEPTTNAKYGVSKRTGDREPVFRDEKDDPFTRTSLIASVLFFCSDLQLRSATQSRTHAQVRRNRANVGTVRR